MSLKMKLLHNGLERLQIELQLKKARITGLSQLNIINEITLLGMLLSVII